MQYPPVSRAPYPHDWPDIARRTKEAAGGLCSKCGCLPSSLKHINLGVHHKDYNPQNNHPDNLVVLCSPCHLRQQAADLKNWTITKAYLAAVYAGQETLSGF